MSPGRKVTMNVSRAEGKKFVYAVSGAVLYIKGLSVSVNTCSASLRGKTGLPCWFPSAGKVKVVSLKPATNNPAYILRELSPVETQSRSGIAVLQ